VIDSPTIALADPDLEMDDADELSEEADLELPGEESDEFKDDLDV
jgi:hypothetical protein